MIAIDNTKIARSMGISGICKIFSVCLSFIYIPIVMEYLGEELYGVWAAILSILSWIEYMDIGIGNGLRNRLAEQLGKGNLNESRYLISSAYILLSLIMLGAVVFFSVCSLFLDYQSLLNLSGYQDRIDLVIFISVFFSAVNFVFSLCKSILFSMQKAQRVAELGALNQISIVVGIIVVSKVLDRNLLVVSIIYGISNLFFTILFNILIFHYYPQLRPTINCFSKKAAKDTMSLGIRFLMIQLAALIVFSTDNVIIIHLYGPQYVTYYSTVNKAFMIIATGYNAFVTPLWSAFTLAKSRNDMAWIRKAVRNLNLLMVPVVIAALLLCIIFRPLAAVWLQKSLDYPRGLIPLMAVYIIIYVWCSGFSMVVNGLEMIDIAVCVAVVQGILNVPLSLFFAKGLNMGICGVLLGSIAVMLISAIIIPIAVKMVLAGMEKEIQESSKDCGI